MGMKRGVRLEIYFPGDAKHEKVLLHDWLFRAARWVGISGGAMFRAEAGYGRHGELRDRGFFSDERSKPMMATFITSQELADALLEYLDKEQLRLFCTLSDVHYGVVGNGVDADSAGRD